MMRASAVVAMVVLLVACTGAEARRAKPKPAPAPAPTVVEKTIVIEKPIPPELLEPCHDEKPREISSDEAKRLAEVRRTSIKKCNDVKAKYRKGDGTD